MNACAASRSGKATRENQHGEWLIVRKPQKKSQLDIKGKAKIMEDNLVSILGNKFEGLREEGHMSKNHAEDHVQVENNEEATKSREVLNKPKWAPVKVKKKVISPIQIHKAKHLELGRNGQTVEAQVQSTLTRVEASSIVNRVGSVNRKRLPVSGAGNSKSQSIVDRTSKKEKAMLRSNSMGTDLKGVVKKHKASHCIVPSDSSSLKMLIAEEF